MAVPNSTNALGDFSFRISGFNRFYRRRWRRLDRHIAWPLAPSTVKLVIWLVTTALIMAGAEAIGPNLAGLLAGHPIAYLEDGTVVIGKRVLVVRDRSRSMETAERRGRLREHVRTLEGNKLETFEAQALGFGVSENRSENLLNTLQTALGQWEQLDAVYAFSDFEVVDDSQFQQPELNYWKSDVAGYQRLHNLLRQHGVKLYLGTVEHSPVRGLAEVAHRSGGGVRTEH